MSHPVGNPLTRTLLIICAAGILAMPTPVAAHVIDDFEQSDFDVDTDAVSPFPAADVQPVTAGIHCIAPNREVRILSPTGGNAFAQLHIGQPDDEVATVMPQEGARLEFGYLLPVPTDITASGNLNRVEVVMTVGLPDAKLELVLVENAASTEQRDIVITGPGTYTFMLADFPSVDLTQIQEIRVNLETTREGDYHISDIRLRETGTEDMGLDVITPIVQGPGDESVQVLTLGPGDPGVDPPRASILNIAAPGSESMTKPVEVIPIEIRVADSGNGAGVAGRRAAVMVDTLPGKADHREAAIDLHIGVEAAEWYPTIPHLPMMMADDADPRAFCAQFMTPYADAAGVKIGEGIHKLIFDSAGELRFENPQVMMNAEGFHVMFNLRLPAGKSWSKAPENLFTVTIESEYKRPLSGTSTAAARPSRSFWAYPSVTGGRSELRMSRSVDRAVAVKLYDVAGRRVRELEIPAGTSVAVWDGRDRGGAPVAAGVYLARVVEAGEARTARIVMVR